MAPARLTLLCAGAASLLYPTAATLGGTPRRPDLVETRVAVSQQRVEAGGTLEVVDVVRNRGDAAAGPSRTGYYLSRDRLFDGRDVLLGSRRVQALLPGSSSRGSASLRVRDSVGPGSYRVLACADDRHRIRETSERGNCRAARAVEVTAPTGDTTPPTFAGLVEATTCLPGPTGGDRSSPFHLRWKPAADDVTPASAIVYLVFVASTSGAERFSEPTYSSAAGAVELTTPPLPADKPYYFVVRAMDMAGNHDVNRVERIGQNICE